MANPYLEGLLAPVTEEVTSHDLPVTGRIPSGLRGRYLRIGPNPLGVEDDASYHWFAGDGMVHGIRLRDGRAEWYRNRWVRSRKAAERLGEEWPAGPVVENFDFAPNTHVIQHAGDTLALVEAGARPYRLDHELNTLGPCDFGGTLKGGYTAHPKEDPATGELHAIGYFFGWDHLEYTVRSAAGEIVRSVEIPVPDGPMVHDFALTEKYVVIYDLPITFSMEEMAEAGASLPYAWNDAHPARVGLMPRAGGAGDVRWIDIPPCWVFHTLNAFDDGDRVVVDLVRFPSFMHGGRLEGNPPPVLDRWTIDPAAGKAVQETVDDRAQEFPRVDERLTTRRHRYGYTVAENVVETEGGAGLMKHDYERGSSETRLFPAGSGVGEAVFVPSAPDSAEDDGYLMTLAFDRARQATDLVIIASQDFTGEPVATVHLPVRVPLGFHGSWAPDLD